MNIDKLRGEIVATVLDLDHVANECETFETELESGNEVYFQAVAKVQPDEDIFVVFSIPSKSRSIFITASDGDITLVRLVLSNLDELQNNGRFFKATDVIAFNNPKLEEYGVSAVALLPLSVSGIFCNLNEELIVDENVYNFRLVTFLSKKEYEVWKDHGDDALMFHLDEIDKDLITFFQKDKAK